MTGLLSVILATISVRLIADLTSCKALPWFRLYLCFLVPALLSRWNYTADAVFVVVVLVLKVLATAEMVMVLSIEHLNIISLWLYSAILGTLGIILLAQFPEQAGLAYPQVAEVKHAVQVFLAMIALAVCLSKDHSTERTTGSRHAWIMTALWFDYMLAGIIVPSSGTQQEAIRFWWFLVACLCMLAWIIVMPKRVDH